MVSKLSKIMAKRVIKRKPETAAEKPASYSQTVDSTKYDLQALYDEFNKKFFSGRLQQVKLRWAPLPGAHGVFTYKVRDKDGGAVYIPGSGEITIDNKYARTEEFTRGVVLHEMTHVWVTQVLRNPRSENGGHNGQFLKKIDEMQLIADFFIPKTEANDAGVTGATDVTQVYVLVLGKGPTNLHQYAMIDGRAMDSLVGLGQDQIDKELDSFRKSLSSWNYTDSSYIGLYRVVNPYWSKFRLDRLFSSLEAPSLATAEKHLSSISEALRPEFAKLVDGTAEGLKRFGLLDVSDFRTPSEEVAPTPIVPEQPPLTGEALSVEEVGVLYAWYQRGDYEAAIYEDELRKLGQSSLADLQFASGRFSLLKRKLMVYTKIKDQDKGYFSLTEAGQELAEAHFDAVDDSLNNNKNPQFPNLPYAEFPNPKAENVGDGRHIYLMAGADDKPLYINTDSYQTVIENSKLLSVNLRALGLDANQLSMTVRFASDLPFFFEYFLSGCKVTPRSVRTSIVQVAATTDKGPWDVGRLRAFVRTMDGIKPGFDMPTSIIGLRMAIVGHLSQAVNDRPAFLAYIASRLNAQPANDLATGITNVTDKILGGERPSEFGDAPLVAYLTAFLPAEVYQFGPMITKHSDDGYEAIFAEANRQLDQDFKDSVTSAPVGTEKRPAFYANPNDLDEAYCIYALDVGASGDGNVSWDLRRLTSNVGATLEPWRKGLVLDLNDPKYINEREYVELMMFDIINLLKKYRINVAPVDVRDLIDSIIERGGNSLYSPLKLDQVHAWFKGAFKEELTFSLDNTYSDALLQLHTAISKAASDNGAYNRFLITGMKFNDPNHDVPNKQVVPLISKHFGSSPDAFGLWLMSWPAGVSKHFTEQGICNPVAIAQVFKTDTALTWEQFLEANSTADTTNQTDDEAMEENEDDAEVKQPTGPLPQASGNVRNLVFEYDKLLNRMVMQVEPLDSDEAKKRRIWRVTKREAPAVAALLTLVMAPELEELTDSIRSKAHAQAAQQASKLATRLGPYVKAVVKNKTPYPGIGDWIQANFGEGLEGEKAAHKAILGKKARLTTAQRKYLTNAKTRKALLTALSIKLH